MAHRSASSASGHPAARVAVALPAEGSPRSPPASRSFAQPVASGWPSRRRIIGRPQISCAEKFGAAVYSLPLLGAPALEMVLGLAGDLNAGHRFSTVALPAPANGEAAMQICGWLFGAAAQPLDGWRCKA